MPVGGLECEAFRANLRLNVVTTTLTNAAEDCYAKMLKVVKFRFFLGNCEAKKLQFIDCNKGSGRHRKVEET